MNARLHTAPAATPFFPEHWPPDVPGEPVTARISASPFRWISPEAIPRRKFVYGRHYIRKFISATIAQPGVGKSALDLVEMLAIATGRPLLGVRPGERTNVWIWNGEDPLEELQRRVIAACLHYDISEDEIEGRLFVDSGRDTRICIAEQARHGTVVNRPVQDAVIQTIRDHDIGVLSIDPFISSHQVSENDNGAIEAVVTAWAEIADQTGCSIELVHHARKTGGAGVTIEDARGASALSGKARSARVLNVMTKEEAESAGVENRRLHFRCEDGKHNLTVGSDKATWYRLQSVSLGNGCDDGPPDHVGVVTSWSWPDAFEGVTAADILAVQKVVSAGTWREHHTSKDWVGFAVAQALGLDADGKADRSKIRTLLAVWIKNGMFVVVEHEDGTRQKRKYVEVGEWATA